MKGSSSCNEYAYQGCDPGGQKRSSGAYERELALTMMRAVLYRGSNCSKELRVSARKSRRMDRGGTELPISRGIYAFGRMLRSNVLTGRTRGD